MFSAPDTQQRAGLTAFGVHWFFNDYHPLAHTASFNEYQPQAHIPGMQNSFIKLSGGTNYHNYFLTNKGKCLHLFTLC